MRQAHGVLDPGVGFPATDVVGVTSSAIRADLSRVPVLDGIRGIAVLAVVFLHTGVLPWGWAGVDIFFVLSGTLITGILLDAKAAGGRGWSTYGKPFYLRRSLRILPLAYAAMAFIFLIAPRLGLLAPVPRHEQLWYWGYLSNWWVWPRSFGAWQLSHFWSLAMEEQFYLCWPWIVLAVPSRRLSKLCAALFLLAPILRLAIMFTPVPPAIGHTYENMTPLRMDGLVAGAFLAVLMRDGSLTRWKREASWLLAIAAAAFVALQLVMPPGIRYVGIYTALAVAVAGATLLLVSDPSSTAAKWLSARWLRWVGTVSYGVYVIHFPITLWLQRHGAGIATTVVATFGLTFALASTSWYFFERPLLTLKRFWPMPRLPSSV